MTASAAATAVSIVIHYAFTRYNYAFIIAKSTGRAAATIFNGSGWWNECSVGTNFRGGIGDVSLHPPLEEGGRINWIGETTFPSFSFLRINYFCLFFPLSFFSFPQSSNNLMLVRKTSTLLFYPLSQRSRLRRKESSFSYDSWFNRPIHR